MDAKTFQKITADPLVFLDHIKFDCGGRHAVYGPSLDSWQREAWEAKSPGLRRAAGQCVEGGKSRCYEQLPRGHGKTLANSIAATWTLIAAKTRISVYCAGADQDQARLLRDAIDTLVQLNPWLSSVLTVQRDVVAHRKTGSRLEVLSGDAASSYGITPSAIFIDELTVWPDGEGEKLWHSLFSAAAKRNNCFLSIISNAGFGMGESWQWKVYESCFADPSWYTQHLDGPKASWLKSEHIEEQRRILPPMAFDRSWGNVWTRTKGDALTEIDIMASIMPSPGRNQPIPGPMTGRESGYTFVAGLDLSTRRDRSALTVVGVNGQTQRIRLAMVKTWAPGADGRIDLIAVQNAVIEAHRKFRLHSLVYDPLQAELMTAQLEKFSGLRCVEQVFSNASNLNRMASAILELFRERKFDMYRDEQMLADLRKLRIVERAAGFKLEAMRDSATGSHSDAAIALAICAPLALGLLSTNTGGAWGGVVNAGAGHWSPAGGNADFGGGFGPSNPHRPNEIQYLEGRYGKFF